MRIGLYQPAPVRYAVGHVGELAGIDLVEVAEYRLLDDIAVERGHAVYFFRADDAEISHLDLVIVEYLHVGYLIAVEPTLLHLRDEPAVYLACYRIYARQHRRKGVDVPFFERLRHDRVVGIVDRAARDVPRLVPAVVVLVHQQPHELGYSERRMRVVGVYDRLIGQVVEVFIQPQMVLDYALQRCGNKEVFLLKSELFALTVVVRGIKHFGQQRRLMLALHRFFVIALGERVHIELRRRLSRPQPKHAHARGVAVTRDHDVVSERVHPFGIDVAHAHFSVLLVFFHPAAEVDGELLVRARHHPHLAARQPHIGKLDLLVLHYALAEQSVFVSDGKAHRGIVERRKAVHKAGREPAEPAVAEPRVGLALEYAVEREAHLFKATRELLGKTEVEKIVFERAPDKELHAYIVDPFILAFGYALVVLLFLLQQYVAHDQGNGFIHLILCRAFGRYCKVPSKLVEYKLLYFVGGFLHISSVAYE